MDSPAQTKHDISAIQDPISYVKAKRQAEKVFAEAPNRTMSRGWER